MYPDPLYIVPSPLTLPNVSCICTGTSPKAFNPLVSVNAIDA